MNKFNQVRKQKNVDDEQAEMFADTMDMIARERAVLRLFSGNKSLQVHNLIPCGKPYKQAIRT